MSNKTNDARFMDAEPELSEMLADACIYAEQMFAALDELAKMPGGLEAIRERFANSVASGYADFALSDKFALQLIAEGTKE